MPNIAQQDYIIIDWEGKDSSNAAKKAEVDAQLKNIYLANPLSLLSVVFKDYFINAENDETNLCPILGVFVGQGSVYLSLIPADDAATGSYTFTIE